MFIFNHLRTCLIKFAKTYQSIGHVLRIHDANNYTFLREKKLQLSIDNMVVL